MVKNKMMKTKITAAVLACLMAVPGMAFAEDRSPAELYELYGYDFVDIDRINQYDLETGGVQEEEGEVLVHKNAATAVLALQLMEKTEEGRFDENAAVKMRDFAKMISRLNVGAVSEGEKDYDAYGDNVYATGGDAAEYLIRLLGYDVYETKYDSENPWAIIGREIGLFKKIDFKPETNITRGELAQMIYNALEIDLLVQTTTGDVNRWKVAENKTLLTEKFHAVFAEGVATAQKGMNIRSMTAARKGTIEIDGVKYFEEALPASDLLGHTVFAVAHVDDENNYTILGMDASEKERTLLIDIEDIEEIRNGDLFYNTPEGEQSVDIDGVESVAVLGDAILQSGLTKDLLGESGELRLCSTEKNADYNEAIITNYKTYRVSAVSKMDDKIYFAHSAQYHGNNFVSCEDKEVYIIKNGVEVTLADIKPDDIVDVFESEAQESVKIVVSDRQLSGRVTEIDGRDVYIDNFAYQLAACYDEFSETDSDLLKLQTDASGSFFLNAAGKIASFESGTGKTVWGFLYRLGTTGRGLSAVPKLKIYANDNTWKELELEETLTLDGEHSVDRDDAFERLSENASVMLEKPIRYRVNDEDKISFLDTAYQSPKEADDSDSVRHAASIKVGMNWTSQSTNYTSLTGTQWIMNTTTQVITVPTDLSRELDYVYDTSPKFATTGTETLDIYTPNDFFVPAMIIRTKDQGSDYVQNYSYMVVDKVTEGVNDDGDSCVFISGFDGTATPNWFIKKYSVSDVYTEQARKLKHGDIIHFGVRSAEISAFDVYATAEELDVDKSQVIADGPETGLGDVLMADTKNSYIKISINGQENTVYTHSLGLYDRTSKKFFNIGIGDVQQGDRIFICGGYGYMRCLIIR